MRHSKKWQAKELEDHNEENSALVGHSSSSKPPTRNPPSEIITDLHMDLTLSDSENEDDIEITNMSKAVKNKLLSSKISRETNRIISSISTVAKSTNTEPLIILSPDEVLEFEDGLTLLSFDKNAGPLA